MSNLIKEKRMCNNYSFENSRKRKHLEYFWHSLVHQKAHQTNIAALIILEVSLPWFLGNKTFLNSYKHDIVSIFISLTGHNYSSVTKISKEVLSCWKQNKQANKQRNEKGDRKDHG